MTWTYLIDKQLDALFIKAKGVLTAEEIRSGVLVATSDPSFHPDIRIFIDYFEVTQLNFSVDTVEAMANHKVYSTKSRRAFLVSPGYTEAVFKYYKSYVVSGKVEVFTDRGKALAWLNEGVPPAKVLR